MAKILQPSDNAIEQAVALLQLGKPLGLPTETVYGLAGDAGSEAAILAIYRTKSRPAFDPLIVHIPVGPASISDLVKMKLVAPEKIDQIRTVKLNQLISQFWPGPLTLILPKHSDVLDLVTSGLSMVGIRMPDHPVAQTVLTAFGRPLAAPSANRFGRISPTTAGDVDAELGGLIDLILDGGPCQRGLESTVVGLAEDGGFNLLRPGSLSVEAVEAALGESLKKPSAASQAASPGTQASHYAPEKKFLLLTKSFLEMNSEDWLALAVPEKATLALLIPCGKVDSKLLQRVPFSVVSTRSLSESEDDAEASRNLFRVLRDFDGTETDVIICEAVGKGHGLWVAIKDRLQRASFRNV